MPTRNVNLTDHQDALIGAALASGRYQNASEVVRDALRLLERREQVDTERLEWLRQAVAEGERAIEQSDFEDVELDDLPAWLSNLDVTKTA